MVCVPCCLYSVLMFVVVFCTINIMGCQSLVVSSLRRMFVPDSNSIQMNCLILWSVARPGGLKTNQF